MGKLQEYVTTESDGAMYVGDARVPMEAIVIQFDNGETPENIRRSYVNLTLEEIYGAITYYLANKEEVLEYMKRQKALWDYWKKKLDEDPPPVVLRLRALKAAAAKQNAANLSRGSQSQ
jgi:uncharacterized protein (DUF433 family)